MTVAPATAKSSAGTTTTQTCVCRGNEHMPRIVLIIVASLIAGFALAAWFVGVPDRGEPRTDPAVIDFDTNAGVEERLLALEAAVSAERQARQLLEDELQILYEVLDDIEGADQPPLQARASEVPLRRETENAARGDRRGNDDSDRRLQALTDAGFSASRADWIVRRESELRMQAMQERFEAMRSGEPVNPYRLQGSASTLRDELGDAEYEMYLEASNRSTSIGVGNVLASSPALVAGLQAGDQITHYDGERVFSTFELTQQTLRGEPGQNVLVDILRDGTPMQVVLPRGPLGITTGRRR